MPDEDLDKILEDLKNEECTSTLNKQPSAKKLSLDDDNINNYIIQKVSTLIDSGIETVEAIQQTIASGFEAEELIAFSGLITSVARAADTLNKINIQNKKSKTLKELKQLDLANDKSLSSGRGNTNILIATREEIIDKFLEKNKNIINVPCNEEDTEQDGDNTNLDE